MSMLGLLSNSLSAEPIFIVAGLTINNSMILGVIGAVVILGIMLAAARRITVKPGGTFASLIELAIEFIVDTTANIMHDRKKAIKFAPMILSIFLFILLNNWIGLLPGVGSIKFGEAPLLRAFTADLNGTLALAVFTVVLIQIYAIRELGIVAHLKHYFSDQPWNPINLFVGVLEIIGEFTKMLSLSLRLFGNVFAGEVLLSVISSISGYATPVTALPFYLMELFVGFIQAFVFTMLAIVFLSVATHHEADSPDDSHSQPDHSPDALLTQGISD